MIKNHCGMLYNIHERCSRIVTKPGPEVIRLFSYSTKLSTKFILGIVYWHAKIQHLRDLKQETSLHVFVGILVFMGS